MPNAGLAGLVSQLQQLHAANTSGATPSKAILTQAKVQLAQAGLLLPSKPSPQGASASDLEAAREILSYGALLSVREGDFAAFQRYIQQVKPFWDSQLGWVVCNNCTTLFSPLCLSLQPLAVKTAAATDRTILAKTARKQRHCRIPHFAGRTGCKEQSVASGTYLWPQLTPLCSQASKTSTRIPTSSTPSTSNAG